METGFTLTLFGLFMVVMIVTILWPRKLSSKKNKSLTKAEGALYRFLSAALDLNEEQVRYIKPRIDELTDEMKLLKVHWDDIRYKERQETITKIMEKVFEDKDFNQTLKKKIKDG